jgi:hypothetical protein
MHSSKRNTLYTLRLPPAELACEGNDLGLRLAERFPSFAPPFLLALASRSEFRNRARLLKLRDDTQHLANQNSCRCVLGEEVGGGAGMIDMPSDLAYRDTRVVPRGRGRTCRTTPR